jgi:hypothetical protein
MTRLTHEDVRRITAKVVTDLPQVPDLVRAVAIAANILVHFLGKATARHVHTELSGASFERGAMHAIHLAEALFCLQDCEGFEAWTKEAEHQDGASVFAEASMAYLAWCSGASVRFVRPNSVQRQSYDIEIFDDINLLFGEIKSRADTTEPTVRSVAKVAKKACEQLPSDRPSILLLWLDERWMSLPTMELMFSQAFFHGIPDDREPVFVKHEKLVGVIISGCVSMPNQVGDGGIVGVAGIYFENARCPHGSAFSRQVLAQSCQPIRQSSLNIHSMLLQVAG